MSLIYFSHLYCRLWSILSRQNKVYKHHYKCIFVNQPILTITSVLILAEPGFYSANWLYLGKVYHKLGQADKARHWLQKAAGYDPKNQEDIEVNSVHM